MSIEQAEREANRSKGTRKGANRRDANARTEKKSLADGVTGATHT